MNQTAEIKKREKSSWVISDWTESEVQCRDCPSIIIFFVYQNGSSGEKRSVPVRCRACTMLYGEYRVQVKAAKNQIKREQGVRRVSRKKLDEVLNELAVKSRRRWQQSKPKKKMLSRKKIDFIFEELIKSPSELVLVTLPYQMKFSEYAKSQIGDRYYVSNVPVRRYEAIGSKRINHSNYQKLQDVHKESVKNALESGKSVELLNLKYYPDLQK